MSNPPISSPDSVWKRDATTPPTLGCRYAPAAEPGSVLKMTAALPWWRYTRAKVKRAAARPQRTLVDK